MKKLGLILIWLFGLLWGSAFANEVTVLGPNQYLRTIANPNVYVENFAGQVGPARLEINNGAMDGSSRVTSGQILLNGKQILGPNDFKKHWYNLQLPVTLAQQNALRVELGSAPESYISLRLTQEGNVAEPFSEGVPAHAMPDLAVTSLTVTPDQCVPGAQVSLQAVVTNVGPGRSSAAYLSFSIDGNVIGRFPVGALDSQGQLEMATGWAAEPGRHQVAARLELPAGEFDRSIDNNMQLALVRVAGEVAPIPEVIIGQPQFDRSPLVPGENYTVTLNVRNPSFVALRNVWVYLFLDNQSVLAGPDIGAAAKAGALSGLGGDESFTSGDDETRAGVYQIIDYLAPGAQTQIVFPWNNLPPGQHMVKVELGNLPETFPLENAVTAWSVVVSDITVIYPLPQPDKWVSMGPSIIPSTHSTGRVDSLAFNPVSMSILFAGAHSGGIWKTTDGGASWKPLGDKLPHTWISALAVDPQNAAIIYAAAGDGGRSASIYKSLDGGQTFDKFIPDWMIDWCKRLVVRYTGDGKVLIYAATDRGVLRYKGDPQAATSTAAEWKTLLPGIVKDMAVHPTNNSTVYAVKYFTATKDMPGGGKETFTHLKGMYRTRTGASDSNTEADWTLLHGPWEVLEYGGGLTLDIFRANPQKLYAARQVSGVKNEPGIEVYSSANGGDTWVFEFSRDNPPDRGDIYYNPYIRVHPTQEWLYYGGVHLFRSSKLPFNFFGISFWMHTRIPEVHDDQKDLQFTPQNPDVFWCCNDGGVWRGYTDAVKGFDVMTAYNFSLVTTEFYDFDVSQTDPTTMIGGLQDNGTLRFDNLEFLQWREIRGGDGLFSLIAPSNNQVMYSQYQSLKDTRQSLDGGASWWNKGDDEPLNGLDYQGTKLNSYITVSPVDPNLVVSQGPQTYASWDGGKNWQKTGPVTELGKKGDVCRVVIQPSSGNWLAGTNVEGQIWSRYQPPFESPIWTLIDSHPEDPNLWVVNMALDPHNPNVLYVMYGGYADAAHRFRLLERSPAGTWSGAWITGDFPGDRGFYSIAGDPRPEMSQSLVYVGTDKGVYRGKRLVTSTGLKWQWKPYQEGLPQVEVVDLLPVKSSGELRAATWGRGVWSVTPHQP